MLVLGTCRFGSSEHWPCHQEIDLNNNWPWCWFCSVFVRFWFRWHKDKAWLFALTVLLKWSRQNNQTPEIDEISGVLVYLSGFLE